LNKKSFENIQGLYIKEHELIADFVPIGSEEDERMIRDMNKKFEAESSDKGVDSTKKRKAGSRMKKMSKRQKTDVDLEEEEKLKTVRFEQKSSWQSWLRMGKRSLLADSINKVLWLGVVEEQLWLISGSTSAKLADVGSMWEGHNTSATCAEQDFTATNDVKIRVGYEDGLMEANAREQTRKREWQQRINDINDTLPMGRESLFQDLR
nr:hypothetical protein [Tanacetum cinerariifolium]